MPKIDVYLYRLGELLMRVAERRMVRRAERRLRDLPPVRSMQSLTEIGAFPDDWRCPHCGCANRRWQTDCEDCGRDRERTRGVR